tara:strand:+ start:237 stop:641 length:405 start_codon:yes stop_codon:yes gene_type:complete
MKKIEFKVSDKDFDLLTRIAKDQNRRLEDLNYLLYSTGLKSFFCETMVSIPKKLSEYSSEEKEQEKKNDKLEETEGWFDLDYGEREAKGYKHVCPYISNHEYNKKTRKYSDPLIEPLADRIASYPLNPIIRGLV